MGEKFLASPHTLQGERKQITVLFADVKKLMELLTNLNRKMRGGCSTPSSSR